MEPEASVDGEFGIHMENIVGERAMLAYDRNEEGALDGAQLICAETDPDMQREQDIFIFIFINGNFAAFLNYVRSLSLRDQELLLAYCLGKGKKHNVSPEGLWRQDVARRRRTGQMTTVSPALLQ